MPPRRDYSNGRDTRNNERYRRSASPPPRDGPRSRQSTSSSFPYTRVPRRTSPPPPSPPPFRGGSAVMPNIIDISSSPMQVDDPGGSEEMDFSSGDDDHDIELLDAEVASCNAYSQLPQMPGYLSTQLPAAQPPSHAPSGQIARHSMNPPAPRPSTPPPPYSPPDAPPCEPSKSLLAWMVSED